MERRFFTFARGFGSGGKEIASALAHDLGIHCYENRILTLASQLSGLDEKLFNEVNEKIRNNGGFKSLMKGLPRSRNYIAKNERYDIPVHDVIIRKASPLYYCLETERISVNSYHHQSVKTVAPCLEIMAESEDGIVEALYNPSCSFLWAVQWHPEFSYRSDENSMKIFREFVKNCY